MTDVPPAVRATLERESAGGKVTEIEKEVKNGKAVYSADMVVNGVAFGLTAAIVPGFDIDSFGWAVLGALVVGLTSWFVGAVVKR